MPDTDKIHEKCIEFLYNIMCIGFIHLKIGIKMKNLGRHLASHPFVGERETVDADQN